MKLSIAQVQSIIDYIDAAVKKGINDHEQSTYIGLSAEINKMETQESMIRLLTNEPVETSFKLTCDDCHRQKPDVEETICPYAQDIEGKEVKACLCKECYNSRAADI